MMDYGEWAFMDKNGDWVIKPTFQVTGRFKDGYTIVGKYDKSNNLKKGIIDKKRAIHCWN